MEASSYLQFSKMRCKEHPFQVISNFCMNGTTNLNLENCITELCSQCICSHTEMHMRQGTSPVYKGIRALYEESFEQVNQCVRNLEAHKDRIGGILKAMSDRKDKFRSALQQAKRDVLKVVQNFFEEAEARFEHEVKCEEKKTGLHSQFQVESLNNKISRQINHLIAQAHNLNSHKFISAFKQIRSHTIYDAQNMLLAIEKDITDNEEFIPTLTYQKQNLINVELSIKKLLSLSFFYPKVKYITRQLSFTDTQNFDSQLRDQSKGKFKPDMNISLDLIQRTTPRHPVRTPMISDENRVIVVPRQQRRSVIIQRQNSLSSIKVFPQNPLVNSSFCFSNLATNVPLEMRLTQSRAFQTIKQR